MNFNLRQDAAGMTLFELTEAMIIILICVAVFLNIINKTSQVAKEVALHAELNNFRSALVLFRALKGVSPDSLKHLLDAEFEPQGSAKIIFGREFLSSVGRDKQGEPVDPFGNKFYYNPEKEVVRSRTQGYENW